MICTKKEFIRTGADGTKWWQVVLTSDTDPDTLNLTGADVENLNDALGLAAGSILITPTANYIAFEDGVFTAKGEGGGGGEATVIVQNNTSETFEGQFCSDLEGTIIDDFVLGENESKTVTLPIGSYVAPYESPAGTLVNQSGAYTLVQVAEATWWYEVRGDCSFTLDYMG